MPRIFLGADHRGFAEKQRLLGALREADLKFEPVDVGPATLKPDDDFNDAAIAVSRAVRENRDSLGILICGSAQGVCIQANRFKGIRAIFGYNPEIVRHGRAHDNANVLCLSSDFMTTSEVTRVVAMFLSTPFTPKERYIRRINRLDEEEIYG